MNKIENKLVPELRFPEFKNDREWNKKSLIDTVDKKIKWSFTGGPFGSNLKASDYTSDGIRIIQLQNIGDGEFNDNYKIYTSKEKADELLSCNIYSGEIILSKMGDPVGRACLIPDSLVRCVMASDGIRLVVNEKEYSKLLIYYLINSEQIRNKIEKKATGSTRKRIGLDELKNIDLIIPESINEQQKIADCLSSLDEAITSHNDKLQALKNHKKGLLQNLFPQERETIPKLRFQEFTFLLTHYKFTELGEIKIGLTHKPDYKKDGIPFLSSKNISKGYIDFDNVQFISHEKFESMPLSTKPKLGDILFTRVGSNLGNPIILDIDKEFGIFVSLGFFRVNNKAYNYYIKYWMETDYFWLQVNQKVAGGAKDNLNTTWLKEIELFLPSIEEQKKIAECLSVVDELITKQNNKVEQLKDHKKGLMQRLFPKVKN
ncbi:restriction endonuclease subunit S [Chryseobacterium indologenes]|uniref:restriction endonuclease subunit S n=1 Tax=Chryseobacterium indologenes TaxID=253 RepID=UPI0016271475|nr:restriction endonuclease subunit S [Chryseobacterium indologenes]